MEQSQISNCGQVHCVFADTDNLADGIGSNDM